MAIPFIFLFRPSVSNAPYTENFHLILGKRGWLLELGTTRGIVYSSQLFTKEYFVNMSKKETCSSSSNLFIHDKDFITCYVVRNFKEVRSPITFLFIYIFKSKISLTALSRERCSAWFSGLY